MHQNGFQISRHRAIRLPLIAMAIFASMLLYEAGSLRMAKPGEGREAQFPTVRVAALLNNLREELTPAITAAARLDRRNAPRTATQGEDETCLLKTVKKRGGQGSPSSCSSMTSAPRRPTGLARWN